MIDRAEARPRLAMDASAWCGSRGLGRYAVQMAIALAHSGELELVPCTHSDRWGPWTIPPELAEKTLVWHSSHLPWSSLRMPLLARRCRPQAVWFPANEAATWGCQPYILTLNDVAQAHYPEKFFARVRDHEHYLTRLKSAVARAARLVTISDYSRRDIAAVTGCSVEQIAMIPLGVDPVFRPVPAEESGRVRRALELEGPYLLYVGGYDFRKNLERLIEAFALLCSRGHRETLVLVGSGGANQRVYPDLRASATRYGVSNRVRFLEGTVGDDLTLRALYNGASVFVFPSLFEGFGLPPLEAMACGTPVVCSTAAALPQVVGEAAVQVDPEDAEGMAQAVARVLDDEELRGRLRAAGRDRAAGYTWAGAAAQFLRLAWQPVAGRCGRKATTAT